MTRILPAALALLLAFSAASQATTDAQLTDDVVAAIRTYLEAEGYEVRSIQMEDGLYEAYVLRDGARSEIYLNANLEIVRGGDDD